MSDEAKSTEMPEKFTLTVKRGAAGLWYVTGSLHPGLFIANADLGTALADVPECFGALLAAGASRKDVPRGE